MCFSAGASFTSGVLLTFVGAGTVKKVHKPSQIVFASIPLFFAVQQFSEGVLWLAMTHAGYAWLKTAATYVFVVMAQILWPVMIPLSVLLLEGDRARKRILYALLAAGAALGLNNLYLLVSHGIHAEINGRHISYLSDSLDPLHKIALFSYFIVTVVPLFVSGAKRMRILGVIMAVSFIVSAVFYMEWLTSVWCFFAAAMSLLIFDIVGERGSHPVSSDQDERGAIIP